MAGPGTYPSSTTYPGFPIYPDPGTPAVAVPLLRSFIDLSGSPTGTPNWSSLSDTRVRSFSTSRGRESELSEFDTGTASLTVDNRDRAFDPTFVTSPYYPYIRPMTRFLLQAELNGTLYGLFLGYADTYDLDYDTGGSDATVTIHMADEFAALASMALPTTSPPRDSWGEFVQVDNPVGYWDFSEDPAGRTFLSTDPKPPAEVEQAASSEGPIALRRGDRRAFPATHARRRR